LRNIKNNNEQQLIKEVAAGSSLAFTTLFELYKNKIFTIAFRITRSVPVAEEIVQDVFVKLWLHRERLADVAYFRAYLFTSARNETFTALKKAAKHPTFMFGLTDVEHFIDTENETSPEAADNKVMLQKAIERLPPQQAIVFRMIKLEGFSREETAEKLRLSPATVKVHLALALRSVRAFCMAWKELIAVGGMLVCRIL